MGSRTNVGAVRSMHMDRGTRIRTFRKMEKNTRDRDAMESVNDNYAAFSYPRQGQDISQPNDDDTNGERYAQALDRLTGFKSRLKKRIWQDHRKIDWREENVRLQRASKELTKAIQDMLESSTWQDCADIAPAWGGSGSTGQKSECALVNQQAATTGSSTPARGLGGLGAEARELEVIRLTDFHADVSHIQGVKGLVAEFVGKGRGKRETTALPQPRRPSQLTSKDPTLTSQHESCTVSSASTMVSQLQQTDCSQAAAVVENVAANRGNTIPSLFVPRATDGSRMACLGSQAALVAQLLVQARTEHNRAGACLIETAKTLEVEAEDSRKAVAAVLVPDRTDVYSSTQAWVLDKIGIGTSVDKGPAENTTRRKMERPKASGVRATEEVLERCGTVQDAVMLAEIYHRLGVLEAKHDKRLATLRDEFLRSAAKPTSAGSVEAALDKNGGWAAERHFRFMKVMKAYTGTSNTGTGSVMISVGGLGRADGKSNLTKRLADELTGVSSAEISRHESWHRLRGAHLAKKRAEKQAHARELDELVVWGKEALDELRHEEKQSAARADEQKERDRRRVELDELLEKQREERELCNRLAREQKEQALLQKLSRETEEATRKAAEDERKRDAVAEYRASLEELRDREAEVREAAAKATEAERVERVPKNRARVGFREEKARIKREEHERRAQEAKAIEANRLQVLEKLAASVPYAEACANAEAKLDHITAATAAHFDQFLPFDRSRGHCPMFGYNTGKVLKDTRLRLGLYLREAGVSGSAAAHSAVMKAAGPLRDAPF